MNDRWSGLSANKRALLERMLKARPADAPRDEPIARRKTGERAPLSYNQEILWVLGELAPESAAYNVPWASRLKGPLDREALGRALSEIVRRHEVLRTSYENDRGTPVQRVHAERPCELRFVDLGQFAEETEREAQAMRLLVEEAKKSFDLARDPIFRAVLLRLRDDEHILLLLTHHIAFDGWSKALVNRELSELYDAFRCGRAPTLAEPALGYADYASWQRQALSGSAFEEQIAFWKAKLAGAPALLEMPLDHPRPAALSYRGLRKSIEIEKSLVEGLRSVAQKEGATLFMALCAAYWALLHRYSGQDDLVVGTPIAGRNRKELESVVGFFANTLVLRGDLSDDPTLRALIARARKEAVEAYAHQDLPFEKLVLELKPERSLSHAPIFQVMIVLRNTPVEERMFENLESTPIKIERGNAKFDLLLSFTEQRGALSGSLEFSTEIFEPATIERFLGHYRAMLEAMVERPETRVSEVSLLSPEERRLVLETWNATDAALPERSLLHQLFEAAVDAHPDAIALVAGTETLSYRELELRSNRLARALRDAGVRPSEPVGLCVSRSSALGIGILGILKAGCACMPLDPSYPRERLGFMLQDARAPIVLTEEALAGALPDAGARLLLFEALAGEMAHEDGARPEPVTGPRDIAYVLFTSGSTGRPKGVLLHHEGLSSTILAVRDAYGISASDTMLQFSSMSFDIHVEELFTAWSTGATVVLRDDEMMGSAERFSRFVDQHRITVVDLPTAYWHEWVRGLDAAKSPLPSSLRAVIVGGEKAQSAMLAAFRRLPGGERVRWFNTVAPTECSIVTTVYEAPLPGLVAGLDEKAEIPVGKPIANARSYVLDEHQRPVPIGVVGEWVIGGKGVSRGYLERPEETRRAFIPDPFSGDPEALLYRTGDRARLSADGNLTLLGRMDEQVKVRGYRIELGEIEAAIAAHPSVAEALVLVLVREDDPSNKRLVAYLVARSADLALGELRSFLKSKLPDHMIPAAFVRLDAFPLSPNGKVDRRALPPPDREVSPLETERVLPRTPVEEMLAEMWSEVLGVREIGIHDNFFDLGGHSLLATRVLARVRESFDVEVPLRRLFEAPTIADLALSVVEELARQSEEEEPLDDFAAGL